MRLPYHQCNALAETPLLPWSLPRGEVYVERVIRALAAVTLTLLEGGPGEAVDRKDRPLD